MKLKKYILYRIKNIKIFIENIVNMVVTLYLELSYKMKINKNSFIMYNSNDIYAQLIIDNTFRI